MEAIDLLATHARRAVADLIQRQDQSIIVEPNVVIPAVYNLSAAQEAPQANVFLETVRQQQQYADTVPYVPDTTYYPRTDTNYVFYTGARRDSVNYYNRLRNNPSAALSPSANDPDAYYLHNFDAYMRRLATSGTGLVSQGVVDALRVFAGSEEGFQTIRRLNEFADDVLYRFANPSGWSANISSALGDTSIRYRNVYPFTPVGVDGVKGWFKSLATYLKCGAALLAASWCKQTRTSIDAASGSNFFWYQWLSSEFNFGSAIWSPLCSRQWVWADSESSLRYWLALATMYAEKNTYKRMMLSSGVYMTALPCQTKQFVYQMGVLLQASIGNRIDRMWQMAAPNSFNIEPATSTWSNEEEDPNIAREARKYFSAAALPGCAFPALLEFMKEANMCIAMRIPGVGDELPGM